MPIDREYGNVLLAGLVANQAGVGQAARQDDQLRIRQEQEAARLAEQARQFDLDQQLRSNLAALQDQRSRQQDGLSLMRDRAQQFARQQQDVLNFQQQFALNEQSQQGQIDRMGLQQQYALDNVGLEYQVDAATQANTIAREELSKYRQMDLRPEGQQLLQENAGKIRALQGQQAEMRPEVYAEQMGQLLADINQSGIEDYQIKQLPPQEQLAQSTQPVYLPDGQVDPYNVWAKKADGSWGIQRKQTPPKPATAEKPVDPWKQPIPTARYGEMPKNEAHALADQRRVAAETNLLNKWKAANGSNPTAKPPEFTQDEVIAEMVRAQDIADQYLSGEEKVQKMQMPPRDKVTVVMSPEAASVVPGMGGWFKYKDEVYYRATKPEEAKRLPLGTKFVIPGDPRIRVIDK